MGSKKVQAIEQAFCKLLQENEFKKITVSRICSNAGVSRATFYTYFDSTESLLREIEDRTLSDILQIYENWSFFSYKTLDDCGIAPVNMEICRYCFNHREVFRALFGPYGDVEFIGRYEACMQEDFLRHVQREASVDHPQLIASACAGAMVGLSRIWFSNANLASVEDMARLRTSVICSLMFLPDISTNTPRESNESEEKWTWKNRGSKFDSETKSKKSDQQG